LSYFYGMQQLDLFGFPIETTAQPKKKEKAVKAPVAPATIAEPEAVVAPEPVVIEATAPVVEPVPATEPAPVAQPVTMEIKETIAIPKSSASKKNTETKTLGKRGRKSFKEMDNEADLVEVPDDEVLQQKLYYSISEVASWFKVNTSLLRYWENEFDILQPRKTRKGDRLFRVEDIKNLQLIYFLLRQRKFSIDGAKNFLKNNRKEADTQVRLVESLTKFKSFLLELKANLVA
jgi:DNA-binding transcriptional MerR regulator